jgi:hypothetical protein
LDAILSEPGFNFVFNASGASDSVMIGYHQLPEPPPLANWVMNLFDITSPG